MRPRLHTFVALAVLTLSPIAVSVVQAQLVTFTHGAAEGGQVKTNDQAIFLSNTHIVLPESLMTVYLAPGDSDLFVYEVDSECFVSELGYVQITATVNDSTRGLEPQDELPLVLCHFSGGDSTHRKSWAVRLSGGPQGTTHWFKILARVTGMGFGRLDQRTVKITRYN